MIENKLQEFSVSEIFSSGEYIIPMYQRNYSWGEREIVQLLDDIYDFWKEFTKEDSSNKRYYIGTLVVYDRLASNKDVYETVDGQQRLTTINVILAVLQNNFDLSFDLGGNKPIIQFENRKTSTEAIMQCFSGNFSGDVKINFNIKDAYFIIKKKIQQLKQEISKTKGDGYFDDFVKCLLNDICLICVHLPEETDLNHYFEIMNNRGEQLEKHEILKAHLLGYLNHIECTKEKVIAKKVLNLIWEGCSNMDYYIQASFTTERRSLIFGEKWDEFKINKFDELIKIYEVFEEEDDDTIESIDDIVSSKNGLLASADLNSKFSIDDSDRFNSIIDFQNFLLHVLLIKNKGGGSNLDDKRLIENFKFVAELEDKKMQIEFVKEFLFILLKVRFLFDQFIIKREVLNERGAWSLKKLNCYSPEGKRAIQFKNAFGDEDSFKNMNKRIVFLLSMFHTGMPSMSYKYWLNGVLKFLFEEFSISNSVSDQNYFYYLDNFAKRIIYDRVLAVSEKGYISLIYGEKKDSAEIYAAPAAPAAPAAAAVAPGAADEEEVIKFLSYDYIKNIFVFNFIDYLFWLKIIDDNEYSSITGIKEFVQKFEFTFRSSIEHYFPQHPKDGSNLDYEFLNSIGNLSLISHSKNSSMGNYLPIAKKEHYDNGKSADSIKQFIMFNKYPDKTWGKDEIMEHQAEILNLLKEFN